MRYAALLACLVALPCGAAPRARKIVLVAGIKSHPPGFHEYLKTVKLLKVLLDRSPNAGPVRTEVYFNGWPEDAATLDTADTVLFISDGQPGDKSPPVPFMTPERMKILEKQMRRGCGIVTMHYTTFITQDFAEQIMEWQGGYYERKGTAETRSVIKTVAADVTLGAPDHAISRGLATFAFKDEYYYKLKFRENDSRLKPILRVPALSDAPEQQIVAWAVERQGGGRGFSTTTGHFFENWKNDSYRKLILNALVWTAGGEVPSGGVESSYVDSDAVDEALMTQPIPALVVVGEDSAAVVSALNSETPRFRVKAAGSLEGEEPGRYKLIVVREMDARLDRYVKRGGGVTVIHPAGGASPEPESVYRVKIADSDNPAFREVVAYETSDRFSIGPERAGIHIVATAQLKAGGPDEPVAFTRAYGKGRIFETALGRNAAAIGIPGTTQLIRYGSLWAAEK